MRNLLMCMTITAVGAFGADTSVGTWKLDLSKTKSGVANPLKSRTEVYELTTDGFVKVTRSDVRADGATQSYSFAVKYDGKEYPVTGNSLYDTISCKRVDAYTTTSEVKKTGGKYRATARWVISRDGQTRTQTVIGTDENGKPYKATSIYQKQ